MFNYNLDYDDEVILESEDVSWSSHDDLEIDNFVLTNQKIYCAYEKSNGLFKKATKEISVLSLSDIKIINGQAMVQQTKYKGSWCIQIQFRQGTEYFAFSDSPKKVIPQWITAINNALGIVAPTVAPSAKKSNPFAGVFAGAFAEVADNFKSVIDTATETFGIPAKQSSDPALSNTVTYANVTPTVQQPEEKATQKSTFCVECGTKLAPGTKFCPDCGHKVGVVSNSSVSAPEPKNEMPTFSAPVIEPVQEDSVAKTLKSQRQQEYVGKVYKCPNCGNVVDQSDAVCDSCGYHLSGKQAVSSAMDFQQKIMEIEMSRKKTGFLDTDNETDKRILALVKVYPIPNNIEDIVEFMHLAIGNIDVSSSKKSFINWLDSDVPTHQLSNAWVAKMQQIYKKAELFFPNEPEFVHIKKAYLDMMKKLKL